MGSKRTERSLKKISVIIPCKDDVRVIECVESIQSEAPIVIVFNGSKDSFIRLVKDALQAPSIHYCHLQRANLAHALEHGIWKSRTDWVLLMDSDCVFEKGAIQCFAEAMSEGNPEREVYKGGIIFRHENSYTSRIIARSRQHHTAEQLTAYKPPLALSKQIAPCISGHFFNKGLIWREDADLDHRIRQAGLTIVPVRRAIIYHEKLTLWEDLRSTFRYGVGEAIADSLGLTLTDVPRSTLSTFLSQGLLPALYMLIRNRSYTAGYVTKKVRLVIKRCT